MLENGRKVKSVGTPHRLSIRRPKMRRAATEFEIWSAPGPSHAIITQAAKLAPHAGHTVRITGMLKEGVIMATKAEMNVNGHLPEIRHKGHDVTSLNLD